MARNETRLVAFRKAVRAVDTVEHKFNLARASVNRLGFPFRAPTIPHGVDVPAERGTTGADFDTDWAARLG